MFLNYVGVGEDSWESLGLQGDQTSQPQRKSVLNIHWKDWCWSWSYNTLATWCEELTHWKRPWCWERLRAGGEGDDRGWDGWMASPTWWTWVWASSGTADGRGSLVCCSPRGHRESDTTERLNWLIKKTQTIPIGRVALGDWLGCHRVGNRWIFYLIWGQGTDRFRSWGSWKQSLWGLVSSRDFFFYPLTLVPGSRRKIWWWEVGGKECSSS